MVWLGMARQGVPGQARFDAARQERRGEVRLRTAGRGKAGTARRG
jgi:hypothetical protein